jgi:hypothetical protein
MNKPLTMIIKETKTKLANVCNESGLPPVILDMIVHDIYSEIHSISERQAAEEEKVYIESLKDKDINDDNVSE